jgi:ABC-2 type transport system permease protein
MSTLANVMPESDPPVAAPAPLAPVRPLYWSLRRELWENHSIYLAPAIAGGVAFLAVLIGVFHPPKNHVPLAQLEPAQQATAMLQLHGFPAAGLIALSLIVGVFYCLDALHAERRDRSILFWKSLPVSDFTTVLSKALIALVVLPLVTFAVIVVLEIILLPLDVLQPGGVSAGELWAGLPFFQLLLTALYGLAVAALWYAPVYGWLLLVSGWARRAIFLWAFVPPMVLVWCEKIAFGTSYIGTILSHRITAGARDAFSAPPHEKGMPFLLPQMDPAKLLASPELWIGLAVAVLFFFAAVRQRRYRGPI